MEDTTGTETTETPVEVKVKKKRTSKTWIVTVSNGSEDYEVKITGVTSAEEAAAKITGANEVIVSVRPARTFK